MKNLLLILCCFIAASTSNAQITSKSLLQDSVLYLTAAQEAFMIDKETKGLFKTSPLAYERKLSKALSINFEFQPTAVVADFYSFGAISLNLGGNLELRNYWRLPELIRSGKQANNLSSEYYGLGVGFSTPISNGSDGLFLDQRKIYAVIGSQKRFLNYGFLDYGVKLGYTENDFEATGIFEFERNLSSISISTFINAGFAFGKRYSINDETKCPIFKCNLDKKSMLKINYRGISSFTYGETLESKGEKILRIDANPNISYERKIGSSPLSINQELDVSVAISTGDVQYLRLNYSIGVRYYNRLKKRIQSGQSGNNLSGMYFKTRGTYSTTGYNYFQHTSNEGEFIVKKTSGSHINLDIGLGYQKTVLKNYYFDLGFSYAARIHTFKVPENNMRVNFDIDIAVGKYF